MSNARRRLCIGYALLALLALGSTWRQNLRYATAGTSAMETNVRFWSDTFANPAATSITVDIVLLVVALFVWAVLEARALGIRYVWAYLIGGMFIAISVTFPLFLIARERQRSRRGDGAAALGLTTGDWVGLAVCSALSVAGAVVSWTR